MDDKVPDGGSRNSGGQLMRATFQISPQLLAEARGVSLDEISRQTTENFFRLFSKVPPA